MFDELVKRLREDAEWAEANEWETPITLSDNLYQAADAIEKLQKLLDGVSADNDSLCKQLDDMNEANIALYGALPKWIPVTEEPPLKVGDDGYNGYLVYTNGYYEVADYTTDKLDNVPYFHVNGEYEPDVTHWMPLPEPPEEGE